MSQQKSDKKSDTPDTKKPDLADCDDLELVPFCAIVWRSDGVYTREETIEYWRISPNTLASWQKEGLPVLARGMQSYRYYGQDVIDFVRMRVAQGSHRTRGAAKKRANQRKNAVSGE